MLKAVVASLDDVQEQYHSIYEQKGDQFILQVEGADSLPDVINLKSAYDREKEKRVKVAGERDAALQANKDIPDDFNIEVWNKAKSGEPDTAAIEAAKVEVRKVLEGERDEWKGKYEGLIADGRQKEAHVQLTDALTKAGVSDEAFLKASRSMLTPQIDFDDEGKARVQSDMGPMSIGDFVDRWAKGEGKAFVKPAQGGDAGTKKSSPSKGGDAASDWSQAKTAKEKVELIKARREE